MQQRYMYTITKQGSSVISADEIQFQRKIAEKTKNG